MTKQGYVLFVGLVLLAAKGQGQPVRDGLIWGAATGQYQPDSARWSLEGSYQYVAYRQASRYYLHFGYLAGKYALTRKGLSLWSGYISGDIERRGRSALPQVRLRQTFQQLRLRPHVQLIVDRLWVLAQGDSSLFPPVTRVRWLGAIEPKLSERFTLVLNTEPFILRGRSWFREVRSQAGFRWQAAKPLNVEVLYFNRWNGFPRARVTWEHIGYVLFTWKLT